VFAGLSLLALWLDPPPLSANPAGGSTHLALNITVDGQCARRRDAPPRLGAASRITAPSASGPPSAEPRARRQGDETAPYWADQFPRLGRGIRESAPRIPRAARRH